MVVQRYKFYIQEVKQKFYKQVQLSGIKNFIVS